MSIKIPLEPLILSCTTFPGKNSNLKTCLGNLCLAEIREHFEFWGLSMNLSYKLEERKDCRRWCGSSICHRAAFVPTSDSYLKLRVTPQLLPVNRLCRKRYQKGIMSWRNPKFMQKFNLLIILVVHTQFAGEQLPHCVFSCSIPFGHIQFLALIRLARLSIFFSL